MKPTNRLLRSCGNPTQKLISTVTAVACFRVLGLALSVDLRSLALGNLEISSWVIRSLVGNPVHRSTAQLSLVGYPVRNVLLGKAPRLALRVTLSLVLCLVHRQVMSNPLCKPRTLRSWVPWSAAAQLW